MKTHILFVQGGGEGAHREDALLAGSLAKELGAGVRRQSFWDRERRHLREALARLVVDVMRLADDAASGGFGLSVV